APSSTSRARAATRTATRSSCRSTRAAWTAPARSPPSPATAASCGAEAPASSPTASSPRPRRSRSRPVRRPRPRCRTSLEGELEVEAGRVHILAAGVAEVKRGVRLVRALVLREAHVAVDAEERLRVGDDVRRDGVEARRERLHEAQARRAQVLLVAGPVLLEP